MMGSRWSHLRIPSYRNPPAEVSLPPRKPRCWNSVVFMADPDRFRSDNLKTYGPIF
jgi:hypothetical protein